MPYPRRAPGGGNAFSKYASAGNHHALEVPYTSLEVDDFVRLRFLDLSQESTAVIPARDVQIINPKNNQAFSIQVQEPENPIDMNGIVDHLDTPMSGCPQKNIFRAPVFVYFIVRGKEREEINALRYIEFKQGLRNSLEAMRDFQNGVGAFNEEWDRPDYDVDLRIVDNTGIKNYEFQPVMADPKNKENHGMHQNWAADADVILKEDGFMEEVDAAWDDVQEAIHTRMTLEQIKTKLARRGDNRGGGGAAGGAVSSKPGRREPAAGGRAAGKNGAAAAEEEPAEEPAVDAEPADAVAAGGGGGRRYGRNRTE